MIISLFTKRLISFSVLASVSAQRSTLTVWFYFRFQQTRPRNAQFHDRFHHRFHNRNFFAFGFGGPIYDHAYDSCWTQVPTRYGWQWVNVCSDYGY